MAQYTVRVELHGKKHDDEVYTELHDAMEAHGFLKYVRGDKTGKEFWLPTAEYIGSSDKEDAGALAGEIQGWANAETSHKGPVGVLATIWGSAGWAGLKAKT